MWHRDWGACFRVAQAYLRACKAQRRADALVGWLKAYSKSLASGYRGGCHLGPGAVWQPLARARETRDDAGDPMTPAPLGGAPER